MSHVTGTVQEVQPEIVVGPDSGAPATAANQWRHDFSPQLAPTGTKFVMLHFRQADFPGANRIEVELGYDTDRFNSADGSEFWTRPINVADLPGNIVPITYVTDGANPQGSVRLDLYGRGERHAGDRDPSSESNSDPFLLSSPYEEPIYDQFWFCYPPTPQWHNLRCAQPASDVRRRVAPGAGMIVSLHGDGSGERHLSTCSGTLIGPDLFATAGHCVNDESEALASSVTFDYETECDGSVPGGYSARFHKVVRVVARHFDFSVTPPYDYMLLQLKPAAGGFGVAPVPLRDGLPGVGEEAFGIHHPNGAVKKFSPGAPAGSNSVLGSNSSSIFINLDVSGGSSGSGLYDLQGRMLGILSYGRDCQLSYFPIATVNADIANPSGPALARDVVLVVDRSGSMSQDAGTGRTKIEEARDAASLFVQLVRTDIGNRIGLVSFSDTAAGDFDIAAVDAAAKADLVGPASPYSGGLVGALAPAGSTSIGAGLEAARVQFPTPEANPRAVLLLTDGMQNTPPSVESVEPALTDIDIQVVGFGDESNLDGALLTGLAQRHDGLYTRAGSGLQLKKFFALAFGNMFEAGALLDPDATLAEGQHAAEPIRFKVCDEEFVTVVLGWEQPAIPLHMRVVAADGGFVDPTAAGVEEERGATWRFVRVALPHNGAREGEWQVEVSRERSHGEFEDAPAARFFVNVVAGGGPVLRRVPDGGRRWFTGDAIDPRVVLRRRDGSAPLPTRVELTVRYPDRALGDVIARSGLREQRAAEDDATPARQATLAALEQESDEPLISYSEQTFELSDRPEDTGLFTSGRGVFGRRLEELFTVEGDYTFHARATYGDTCVATRETVWNLHVDAGIDPDRTEIRVERRPEGRIAIALRPRDRYGHLIGPGRAGDLSIEGTPGTTVTTPPRDEGDGGYTVEGTWDRGSGRPAGVVIGQPGRPAVVVQAPGGGGAAAWWWKALALLLGLAVVVLVLLILLG